MSGPVEQMSGPVEQQHGRRRRLVLGGAALAVLALVVALVMVLTAGGGAGTSSAGSPSGSAPAAATPGASAVPGAATTSPAGSPAAGSSPAAEPAPATGEVSADQLPDSLPAVALDQPAEVSGVSVRLSAIEGIQGVAEGPGNVNGPAVRVTVVLTNGSATELDLDGVSVNLTHGDDLTPGSPLEDASQDLFSGSLAPGGESTGVYVFSVPAGDRERVDVSVGVAPGASYAVFSGPVV